MKAAMKVRKYVGLVMICLLLCPGLAIAQDDRQPGEAAGQTAATTKDRTSASKDAVVHTLSKIEHNNPDFTIQFQTEDDRRTYYVGDRIGFRFKTSRDAYVSIIDVGTSGKIHVLFPNKWHRDNRVQADRWYRLPPKEADYAFTVQGPEGVNYVKAIATLDRYDVIPRETKLDGDKPFFDMKDPERTVKDISAELNRRERKGWTETESRFKIVPTSFQQDVGGTDRDQDDRRDPYVVKVWTDRKSYRIGDPVSFFFYAERDCYLNLVAFGTGGSVKLIFPNRFQRDNLVRAGQVLEIPSNKAAKFLFRAAGPPGIEMIKAVATIDKLQLFQESYDSDEHSPQKRDANPESSGAEIRARLSAMPDDHYVRSKTTFKVEP